MLLILYLSQPSWLISQLMCFNERDLSRIYSQDVEDRRLLHNLYIIGIHNFPSVSDKFILQEYFNINKRNF